MATQVVNIRTDTCEFYIGRAGHGHDGYFGNPHPVFIPGRPWTECKLCKCRHSRGESVVAYAKDFPVRINSDPQFKARVEQLKDRTIGCFCRPKGGFQGKLMCHGQVIAGFLDGVLPEHIE
jgi:hypothetical protein